MWRMISGSKVVLLRLGTDTTNPNPWAGQRPPKTHLGGRQRPIGPFFLLFTHDSSISTSTRCPFLMPPSRKALPGWRSHHEQMSSRSSLYHLQTVFALNSSDSAAFFTLVSFAKWWMIPTICVKESFEPWNMLPDMSPLFWPFFWQFEALFSLSPNHLMT